MAQWLDRVKFGSGKSGSPAVSGTINSYAACTGTATQLSLTTALSAELGDVILIHQSQGTGAGQWEINYVLADAGATLTLAYPLAYTYGTGAQAVLVPQYTGGTLSGTVTATAWNGTVGGIIALMSSGTLTINSGGSLNADGGAGSKVQTANTGRGTGGGYRGGNITVSSPTYGYQGEGNPNAGTTSTAANGNGAGAGGAWGGAGGGHATAGAQGTNWDSSPGGNPGGTIGTADLMTMLFGGAGGGGYRGNTGGDVYAGGGGAGGGAILVIAKSIIVNTGGNILARGGNGGNCATGDPSARPTSAGGGGAGGSIILKAQTMTLGTNLVLAGGGTRGDDESAWDRKGGNGGVGRIHLDYFSSYSGSTTPTLDVAQDLNLKSQVYTGMI